MKNNLLNLLPREQIHAYIQRYRFRVGVVALSALLFLILAHLALLVPSYMYARVVIESREAELARLSENLTSPEEREVSARLTALLADTAYLGRRTETPGMADGARALLAVSRPGITITGITFAAPKEKEAQKMTVSGTAQTRGLLRQYVQALGAVAGVLSADVPISTYAQEADIRFTVTLTGTPTL